MHSESIALSMHVHRLSASTIFFKGYNCSMCEIDNEKVLHHHSHQFQVGKLQKRLNLLMKCFPGGLYKQWLTVFSVKLHLDFNWNSD